MVPSIVWRGRLGEVEGLGRGCLCGTGLGGGSPAVVWEGYGAICELGGSQLAGPYDAGGGEAYDGDARLRHDVGARCSEGCWGEGGVVMPLAVGGTVWHGSGRIISHAITIAAEKEPPPEAFTAQLYKGP